MRFLGITQILITSFLAACSVEPQNEENDNKNKRDLSKAPIAKGVTQPDADKSSSERVDNPPSIVEPEQALKLVGYVKGEIPLAETSVHILGTEYSTTANADGKFVLDAAWIKDIESVSLYALKEHEGKTYGSIINDVKFAAKEEDEGLGLIESVPEIPMSETGAVRGVIKLKDAENNVGIDVYLPGTKFIAKTAENGEVHMDGIPAGHWLVGIQLEKVGYVAQNIKDVEVPSGGEFIISNNTIELDVDLRVNSGSITLADGSLVSKSKSVKVALDYPSQVTRMMLSEDEAFVDKKWVKVQKTTSHEFKNNGNVTLYVKFSDAAGLETAPISAKIFIDAMTDEEKKKSCEQDPSKVYFEGECVPRTFFTDCKNPAPAHTATVNALKAAVGKDDCKEAYDALIALEGKLDIAGKNITDLTPVRGILSNLAELDISSNPVEKLEPLAGLSSLTILHAASTIVTDSKEFRHASGLKELNIENVPVTSFTGLASMQVHSVTVGGPYMSTISDLSTVGTLTSLTINNTVFENAQFLPIASMPGLKHLVVVNTEKDRGNLSEIPFANKLTKLETLIIKHHQVKDLSPLAELRPVHVDLTGNLIEDASPVSPHNLAVLVLRGNKISNIEWLEKGAKLTEVDISGNPVYHQLQSLAPHGGLAKFSHDTGKVYDSMCPTKDAGKGLIAFCSNKANVVTTPAAKLQYTLGEGRFDCGEPVEVKFESVPGIKNELRVHSPHKWIVDGEEVEGHEWIYVAGKKVEITKNDCLDAVLKIEVVSGSKGTALYNKKVEFYHTITHKLELQGGTFSINKPASAYADLPNHGCRFINHHVGYDPFATPPIPKHWYYTFNGVKNPGFHARATPIVVDKEVRINFPALGNGYYNYIFSNKEENGEHKPDKLLYSVYFPTSEEQHFRFVPGVKYWIIFGLTPNGIPQGFQPAELGTELPFGKVYLLRFAKVPGDSVGYNNTLESAAYQRKIYEQKVTQGHFEQLDQSSAHEIEFQQVKMLKEGSPVPDYTYPTYGVKTADECQGSYIPYLEFAQ